MQQKDYLYVTIRSFDSAHCQKLRIDQIDVCFNNSACYTVIQGIAERMCSENEYVEKVMLGLVNNKEKGERVRLVEILQQEMIQIGGTA